jgi:hypothetical protein
MRAAERGFAHEVVAGEREFAGALKAETVRR